jgi:hypothetical protein
MLTRTLFLFCFFLAFFEIQSQSTPNRTHASEGLIWEETVGSLLKEPLWKTRDAYDAGHILMIPLHHAFLTSDSIAIKEFEIFFKKMGRAELPEGQLNQVQIIYLASQYLSLKKKQGFSLDGQLDSYLAKRILNYVLIKWKYDIAFQWGKPPFLGLKSRLDYALQTVNDAKEPSYYRAITDFELFLFGIASDISYISKDLKILAEQDTKLLNEINDYLLLILESRGTYTDDAGWFFQKGFWTDHSSFIYSGNLELENSLEPKKVDDITKDSSHGHRWPLWIASYYSANAANRNLLFDIYKAFSIQFNTKIAVKSPLGALMNNFVNGHNGVYRYKYKTTGRTALEGYGPYNLSGTLGMAWYCFLNDTEDFYRFYADSYPLNEEILTIYVGPNTTRNRNELFKAPGFYTNGFAELMANQAYEISKNYKFQK